MTNRYLFLLAAGLVGCTQSPYYNLDTGKPVSVFEDPPPEKIVCGVPGDSRAAGFSFYMCVGAKYSDDPFGETLASKSTVTVYVDSPNASVKSATSSNRAVATVWMEPYQSGRSRRISVTGVSPGTTNIEIQGADGKTIDSIALPVADPVSMSMGVPTKAALLDSGTLPACVRVYAEQGAPLIGRVEVATTDSLSFKSDLSACPTDLQGQRSLTDHPFMLSLPKPTDFGTATFTMGAASRTSTLSRISLAEITDIKLWYSLALLDHSAHIGASFLAGDIPVLGAECDVDAPGLVIDGTYREGTSTTYRLSNAETGTAKRTFTCSLDHGRLSKSIKVTVTHAP